MPHHSRFTIPHHRLLSREEEYAFGNAIQAGLPYLYAELNSLTSEEISLRAKAIDARNYMAQHNQRLVFDVAIKNLNSMPLEERFAFGQLGLMKAIDKYRPEERNAFSTMAYYWIRQAITRGYQNNCSTIRLPAHIYDALSKIRKLPVNPTEDQITEAWGTSDIKLAKVTANMAYRARGVTTLDKPVQNGDGCTLAELIGYDPKFMDDFELHELRSALAEAIGRLKPEYQDVLRLFYYEGMKMTDIAKQLGYNSHQAARYTQKRAIRALMQDEKLKAICLCLENVAS